MRVLPLALVALTLASSPTLAEDAVPDEKRVVVTLRPIRSIELTPKQARQARDGWRRAELESGLLTLRENTLTARRGYSLWEDEKGGKHLLPIPAAGPIGVNSEIRIEIIDGLGEKGLRYTSCQCKDSGGSDTDDDCGFYKNGETGRVECKGSKCECELDIKEIMVWVSW